MKFYTKNDSEPLRTDKKLRPNAVGIKEESDIQTTNIFNTTGKAKEKKGLTRIETQRQREIL